MMVVVVVAVMMMMIFHRNYFCITFFALQRQSNADTISLFYLFPCFSTSRDVFGVVDDENTLPACWALIIIIMLAHHHLIIFISKQVELQLLLLPLITHHYLFQVLFMSTYRINKQAILLFFYWSLVFCMLNNKTFNFHEET